MIDRHFSKRNFFIATLAVTSLLSASLSAQAKIYYVDNRLGSNLYDGEAAEPGGGNLGPTRSIGKAIELAGRGDTIIVKNTGTPYFESLSLAGKRDRKSVV